ncbi:hypothetical protein [Microbulbifer sp. TYP-18]|uniref:hypothetical protein n=1 Tax=Microbulbifer sp. TYP-18 TaxID=3230024 RepID=UPI0034C5C1E2
MNNLLDQVGGTQVVNQTVKEFFQVIGRQCTELEFADYCKQCNRQAQFVNHALSPQPEPVRLSRASFLARGLNPPLFEALLEYLEGRLIELGFTCELSSGLVETTDELFRRCDQKLPAAC